MAKVAELAEPTAPAGGLAELLAGQRGRGCAGGTGLRPRASGPTRHRTAARGPLVPLVVGVDSSTSACKVQVRDADTGAVVAAGRAAHSATSPPRSEQHPVGMGGGIPRRLRAGRPSGPADAGRHCRRRATARARRPRRRRRRPASGQALERHRVCTGHRLAPRRPPRWSGRLGGRVRERPGPELHHHQAALAAPVRARDVPARRPPCCSPTTGSPSGSRAGAPPTGGMPRAPGTGRPGRSATARISCAS